jgi:hypothetical protein
MMKGFQIAMTAPSAKSTVTEVVDRLRLWKASVRAWPLIAVGAVMRIFGASWYLLNSLGEIEDDDQLLMR